MTMRHTASTIRTAPLRFAGLLALTAAAFLPVACSSGNDNSPGNIAFESANFPFDAIADRPVTVSFEVFAESPKTNVEVTLELVPISGTLTLAQARGLVPGSEAYEAVAMEIGGTSVSTVQVDGTVTGELTASIPSQLAAGSYLPVLRINKRTSLFSQVGRQIEPEGGEADNFVVGILPIAVAAATAPNLAITEVRTAGASFSLVSLANTEDTHIDEAPEPGLEVESEGDIKLSVIVEASGMDVTGATDMLVEVGIADENGDVTYQVATIIDRTAGTVGTATTPRYTFAADATSGLSFGVARDPNLVGTNVGVTRGVALEVLLPTALRESLETATTDTALSIRVTVDPDNAIAEHGEAGVGTDNVLVTSMIHIAPDVVEEEPAEASLASDQDRGAQSSAVLNPASADRFNPLNTYPIIASAPSKAECYGARDGISLDWNIASSLSYDYASEAEIASKARFVSNGNIEMGLIGTRHYLLTTGATVDFDSTDLTNSYAAFRISSLGHTIYDVKHGLGAVNGVLPVKTLHDLATNATFNRTVSTSTYLWIGPVPVKVTAGGMGSIGMNATLVSSLDNRLMATAGPIANLEAFSSATVDIDFATVAAQGSLRLIDLDTRFKSELHIRNDGSFSRVSIACPLALKTMEGRMIVRSTWPLTGTLTASEEQTLGAWDGMERSWEWFHKRSWSLGN